MPELTFRRTVTLQFAPVIQLSVENGRCAFVLQEGSMSSLWLVNLKPFNSIEEFEKDPPEVVSLSTALDVGRARSLTFLGRAALHRLPHSLALPCRALGDVE